MADLYETLGLGPDATEAEIKAAHRRAVKVHHPDRVSGDREKFDRVQRAFTVLSDAGRRARYDETGADEDVNPEALARAQAMSKVAEKMSHLLSDPKVDPRYFDLVLGIRELIDAEISAFKDQVRESTKMQTRLRQFAKRLKRKAGAEGHDRVSPMITSQIEAHAGRIAMIEDGLKALALAKELVEEYVYETEKAEQLNPLMGINRNHSIFWNPGA